jgi:hypothetical protein
MYRIFIGVSYNEREQAKNLNCKYDADRKEWYVDVNDISEESFENNKVFHQFKPFDIFKVDNNKLTNIESKRKNELLKQGFRAYHHHAANVINKPPKLKKYNENISMF